MLGRLGNGNASLAWSGGCGPWRRATGRRRLDRRRRRICRHELNRLFSHTGGHTCHSCIGIRFVSSPCSTPRSTGCSVTAPQLPTEVRREGSWQPAVDVYETDDHALVVSAELPGIDRKDVNTTLENGVLTIAGERKIDSNVDRGRWYRSERHYGMLQPVVHGAAHRGYRGGHRGIQGRNTASAAAAEGGCQAASHHCQGGVSGHRRSARRVEPARAPASAEKTDTTYGRERWTTPPRHSRHEADGLQSTRGPSCRCGMHTVGVTIYYRARPTHYLLGGEWYHAPRGPVQLRRRGRPGDDRRRTSPADDPLLTCPVSGSWPEPGHKRADPRPTLPDEDARPATEVTSSVTGHRVPPDVWPGNRCWESGPRSTGATSRLPAFAPRSNNAGMPPRRSLSAGRISDLGATPDFHRGLLD